MTTLTIPVGTADGTWRETVAGFLTYAAALHRANLGITDLEGRPAYDDTNAMLATLNDLGELFDAARRALMAGDLAAFDPDAA